MNIIETRLLNRIALLQTRKAENGKIVKKLERKLAKIRGER